MRRIPKIGDPVSVIDSFLDNVIFTGIFTEDMEDIVIVTNDSGEEFPCLVEELRMERRQCS